MSFKTEVKKEYLLKTLKANRDRHREVYEHAMDGYIVLVTRLLEEHLKSVKAGKKYSLNLYESMPADHTSDYDQVIKMLEIHEGGTMILDQGDVAQYVMDNWGWKRQHIAASNKFSGRDYTTSQYGDEAASEDDLT
jgi:hypothetical protein